jgi:D-sedoheptulose 7-phosphate isomerase
MTTELAQKRIRESLTAQERLLAPAVLEPLVQAADALAAALLAGNKLLAFGNGGSAADATHIAGELVGRFLRERRALPALSLTDNPSAMTAIANDYAFDRVFVRQVEAFGVPGDVALGISTSGASRNVVAGLMAAREASLTTVALTGGDGGELPRVSDHCIVVPSPDTPRIQEGHTLLAHVLCELVEQAVA